MNEEISINPLKSIVTMMQKHPFIFSFSFILAGYILFNHPPIKDLNFLPYQNYTEVVVIFLSILYGGSYFVEWLSKTYRSLKY